MANNILNFPSQTVKRSSSKFLQYLELILVSAIVFGVLLRNVVKVNGGVQMILLSGVLLPLIYLIGGG